MPLSESFGRGNGKLALIVQVKAGVRWVKQARHLTIRVVGHGEGLSGPQWGRDR
jgi:hypothetical protein